MEAVDAQERGVEVPPGYCIAWMGAQHPVAPLGYQQWLDSILWLQKETRKEVLQHLELERCLRQPWKCSWHLWQENGSKPWAYIDVLLASKPLWEACKWKLGEADSRGAEMGVRQGWLRCQRELSDPKLAWVAKREWRSPFYGACG